MAVFMGRTRAGREVREGRPERLVLPKSGPPTQGDERSQCAMSGRSDARPVGPCTASSNRCHGSLQVRLPRVKDINASVSVLLNLNLGELALTIYAFDLAGHQVGELKAALPDFFEKAEEQVA